MMQCNGSNSVSKTKTTIFEHNQTRDPMRRQAKNEKTLMKKKSFIIVIFKN